MSALGMKAQIYEFRVLSSVCNVFVSQRISHLHTVHSEIVEAGCDVFRHSAAVEVFVEEHVVRANQSRVDLHQQQQMAHTKIHTHTHAHTHTHNICFDCSLFTSHRCRLPFISPAQIFKKNMRVNPNVITNA